MYLVLAVKKSDPRRMCKCATNEVQTALDHNLPPKTHFLMPALNGTSEIILPELGRFPGWPPWSPIKLL